MLRRRQHQQQRRQLFLFVIVMAMIVATPTAVKAQEHRRQQQAAEEAASTTTTTTILPGDASWLGDYGDGDGTPDINDYLPITYTVFGPDGVAIPRIVVPLNQSCPGFVVKSPGSVISDIKLRVQGDFNLPHAFPVKVCEVRLDTDALKDAWSAGTIAFSGTDPSQNVVIPTNPRRVLIFGDTGLRVKPTNLGLGTCDRSPFTVYGVKQCPFNFTKGDVNLTSVAGDFQPLQDWHLDNMLKVAVDQHPDLDLAVHVGDYVYRQGPCPTQLLDTRGDCVGINGPASFRLIDLNGTVINFEPGNWGDNLLGWWSDFFYPARSILQKVPFIAMRGNHETCDRAGHGYFFFLDVGEYNDTEPGARYCVDYTPPFAVPFEQEQYIVQDSSNVHEKDGGIDHFQFVQGACPDPPQDGSLIQVAGANRFDATNPSQTDESIDAQVALYEAEMIQLAAMAERYETNIILTHRPLFAVGCNNTEMVSLDWTLERAISPSFLTNVSGVISGHMHWLEVVEFQNMTLPTQIVVGHGGTKLIPNYVNPDVFSSLELVVGYQDEIAAKVSKGFSNSTSFGYGVIVRNSDGDYDVTFCNYDQTRNATDTLEYQLVIPKTRHLRSNTDGDSDKGNNATAPNYSESTESETATPDSSGRESTRNGATLFNTLILLVMCANMVFM